MNSPEFVSKLPQRKQKGTIAGVVFLLATMVGIIALGILLFTIINDAFGFVAVEYEVEPETLTAPGNALESLSKAQLVEILKQHLSKGLVRRLEFEKSFAERSRENVYDLVWSRVVNPRVRASWSLTDSLFRRAMIEEQIAVNHPQALLQFRARLRPKFLTLPQSSVPDQAGVRTAILGSLWMMLITILFAFPLGVGTAIYLEEYARRSFVNRVLQVNIYNLAGIPSIIYGMLGLAVFVRLLEPLTSGALFGDPGTANGRTILSAGLTLGLLVLPIIIINAQEAIRAVPQTLRYSSFGLGATKWQTVWHHVLPSSFDRILTGTILALSRAIGETAPLVVVGASTFVALDPKSIFSKFTTLPIQIYQWTARPQAEFRNAAAAAILVLLVLLLAMNTTAVLLRNKIRSNRNQGT